VSTHNLGFLRSLIKDVGMLVDMVNDVESHL